MQRFILIGLLAATWTVHTAQGKPSVDDGIAQYGAICGINLLAKDVKHEHGRLLLRFALALRPTSNTTLLAAGMLEKGLAPDPIATKMTEARLYSGMAERGHWLRRNRWSHNNKAGKLALLYYRMAERFRPDDEKIMLGLMKLRLGGIEGDLEQAFAKITNLTDVFGNPEKRPPHPKPELELIDRNIAKYAAIWGTNRLAADPTDANGLLLLQLAGCLTPRNDDVLLTLALLERGRAPTVIESKESEKKLLDVITDRGRYLVTIELPKNKDVGRLTLLYFKVVERFRPADKNVILGLMKLKMKGVEGELDELLATGPSLAAREPVPEPESPVPTRPVIGKPWTVAGLDMELMAIRAGSFVMGAPDVEGATPHKVRLRKAFWLGKYEVTQAQYERVMGENPSHSSGPNLPVENVSWARATDFCGRLIEREGKARRLPKGYVYRLPTEAEWEYSCRAGTQTAYYFGDAPEMLGDYAWYNGNSGKKTHEVGKKKPNAWGLYDMHGNVWEWCRDRFGEYPAGAATDPLREPRRSPKRVVRGGRWYSAARDCRAAWRSGFPPARAHHNLGFRVALAPTIAPK